MKQNMSSMDRYLRAIFALLVAVLIYFNILTGTAAILLGIIAGVFFLTALLGFCPLYALFKLSTKK
jgi:uncharacterized membrane protein